MSLWDRANSFHHQQIIEYDELTRQSVKLSRPGIISATHLLFSVCLKPGGD